MASADLSRRVEKVVGDPRLCEVGEQQRREYAMLFGSARDRRERVAELSLGQPATVA
jgi:hypothetical protein